MYTLLYVLNTQVIYFPIIICYSKILQLIYKTPIYLWATWYSGLPL
jgi:hypothetical protein